MESNKVAVAMSGGVDSSVAIHILKQKGYKLIGITMKLFNNEQAVRDAKEIAHQLGIEHHTIDLRQIFDEKIVDYFCKEYFLGRTPNPCIKCNKFIKFGELLKYANKLGAFYLATGHYARVEFDNLKDKFLLKKAKNIKKDQSYVLYNLKQQQLKHILTPLGYYSKQDVRNIAKQIGLSVAQKPESQEICFIQDKNYANFLKNRFPDKIKPGIFVDINGNPLGVHKGIIHYTIGQRKGLGIALGKPMYVVDIDYDNNFVILGEYNDVFSKQMWVEDVNLIYLEKLDKGIELDVKIRYNAKPAPALLYPIGSNKILVEFKKPQRAITPGQSAVFYDDDVLVGGGTITKAIE